MIIIDTVQIQDITCLDGPIYGGSETKQRIRLSENNMLDILVNTDIMDLDTLQDWGH